MNTLKTTLFAIVIAIAGTAATANANTTTIRADINNKAIVMGGDCRDGVVDVDLYKADAPEIRDGMAWWSGLDTGLCYRVLPGHAPKPAPTAGTEVEPIADNSASSITGLSAGLVGSIGLVDHKTMIDRLGGVGLYLRWEDEKWQAQFEGTVGGELHGRPTDWDFGLSILASKKLDDKLRLGAGVTYQLLLDKDAPSKETVNAHDFGGFVRLGIEWDKVTIAFDGGGANVVKWRRGDERYDGFGFFGRASIDLRFTRF